jgi:alkylhydroperoxidase family enzyme
VILLTSIKIAAQYEWVQHQPISDILGVTDAQREEIASSGSETAYFVSESAIKSTNFDEAEKALLAFTEAVILAPDVSEPIFKAMRNHFSDREIVEVIILQVRFEIELHL